MNKVINDFLSKNYSIINKELIYNTNVINGNVIVFELTKIFSESYEYCFSQFILWLKKYKLSNIDLDKIFFKFLLELKNDNISHVIPSDNISLPYANIERINVGTFSVIGRREFSDIEILFDTYKCNISEMIAKTLHLYIGLNVKLDGKLWYIHDDYTSVSSIEYLGCYIKKLDTNMSEDGGITGKLIISVDNIS